MEISPTPFLRLLRVIEVLGLAIVVSSAGYGLVRWRKILVHQEVYSGPEMKTGRLMSTIKPGHDLRTMGAGRFTNQIAEPLAVLFTPLRAVEAWYWNTKPDSP